MMLSTAMMAGRKAQRQHSDDDASAVTAKGNADCRLPPEQEYQDIRTTGGLRKNRSQRRALYAHVQGKDEDGVQNDIQHCAQDYGHHALAGESLADHKGV